MRTRLAVYVNLYSVEELLNDVSRLEEFVSFLKRFGVEKVFLENYRDGRTIDVDQMARARDLFERDFIVAGGVAIGTWGPGMGENAGWWKALACVSDERNLGVYVKAVEDLAKIFNEIIVDDFWANWCYSKRDIDGFNEMFGLDLDVESFTKLVWLDNEVQRLWVLYSQQLMSRVSKLIVERARAINSSAKLILKFAEWRESYLHRGLSLKVMAELFDGVYVGTESREGAFRYGSTFIVDFARALVGDKLKGVWFDTYNGLSLPSEASGSEASSWRFPPSSPQVFAEQLWHSFLGSVEEVTLFQGTELLLEDRRSHTALLSEVLPRLRHVESFVGQAKIGLVSPAIQTAYRSPYDSYLEDILGSIGVPITSKRVEKLTQGDIVLVKENMLNHVSLWGLVKKGVSILLSSAACERIAQGALGPDGLELIGVEVDEPVVKHIEDSIAFTDGSTVYMREHRRPYALPLGPVLRARKEVKIHLFSVTPNGVYPALYEVDHGTASVFVTSLTRYPMVLAHGFHEIARQMLRDIVYRYVGLKIDYRSRGLEYAELSNISSILYRDTKSVTIINDNIHDVIFSLAIDRDTARVKGIDGAVLGNAYTGVVEEKNGVLKVDVKICSHSFDVIKFT